MAGAKIAAGCRLALLGVAVATLLFAAGCGSSSKSSSPTTTQASTTTTSAPLGKAAYVAKMKAIGRKLSGSLNPIASVTTAAKAATLLATAQTDLRDAADKIGAITPPKPVKSEHAQLEKAVRDFAHELTPVIAKLKAGKMSALSTLPSLKGYQEILSASSAIASKGYKIGG